MIGDPPNIIIGNGLEEHIGFVDFIVSLAPGVLIMAIPALYLLRFLYKGELTGRLEKYDEVRPQEGALAVISLCNRLMHGFYFMDS